MTVYYYRYPQSLEDRDGQSLSLGVLMLINQERFIVFVKPGLGIRSEAN